MSENTNGTIVRPVPPIPEWASAGRKAVATRLSRLYGDAMAREIASQVLEPEQLAADIGRWNDGTGEYVGGNYTIYDVQSGRITLVEAKMPVAAPVADPTNGRVGGSTDYPAADQTSTVMPRIRRWGVDDEHRLVGVLRTRASIGKTASAIRTSVADAQMLNNEIKGQIAEQSILDPIIGLPTRIEMTDGEASRVVVIEGNTRLGAALELQSLPGYTGLLGLQTEPGTRTKRGGEMVMQPDEVRHDRLVDAHREIEALAAEKLEGMKDGDLARLRTWVVKVLIPIAWDVHPHAEDVTLLDGLHEYLERRHVRPPKQWTRDASLAWDSMDLVDLLEQHEYLTEKEMYAWAGDVSPDGAAPMKLDELACDVQRLMFQASTDERLKGILRPFLGQKYVTKTARARLIASLVLRQKAFSTPSTYRAVASAYERTLDAYPAFWERTLWSRSLEEDPAMLLDEAIGELGEDRRSSAADELALRALPYLVFYGALRRETSADTRSPATILTLMASSRRGLSFLAEAISRGRDSEAPSTVDEAGLPFRTATGEYSDADDAWVRDELVPRATRDEHGNEDDANDGDESATTPAPKRPDEQVAELVDSVIEILTELDETVRALKRVPIAVKTPDDQGDDDGGDVRSWVDANGIRDADDQLTNLIKDNVLEHLDQLRFWALQGKNTRGGVGSA